MNPITFFGTAMHTEAADLKIVQTMRKWTTQIFQKNLVLSNKYITKLNAVPTVGAPKAEGKQGYDFDLMVKIVQLFKVDDY